MAIKLIEFLGWEPDQPDFAGAQTQDAQNVIPVKRGYRPFPGPVNTALPPLDSAVFGAFSFMDSSGTVLTLAATSNAIYQAGVSTWTSNASGFGATSPWQFAQYGDTILATNFTDGPQYATAGLGSITAFSDLTGASNASFVSVVKDFVMLGDINGFRNAVQWSAINDPLDWPAVGSIDAQNKQSDRQIFPAGGNVQAVIGGLASVDGLIFLEHAVYRALYVGPPLIFQFDVIERQQGTPAPYSVVKAGGFCLYLGEDGWHKTDGVNSISIGADRVDQWFKTVADPLRVGEVRGVLDPINSVAMWAFASTAAPTGRYDYILVYNYVNDKWSYAALDTEFLYANYSATATLESLDAYGTLDSLPFSLDSKAFMGGTLAAGLFTPAHQQASLTGTPLAASMTTAETGGTRIMVTGVRPLVDGATPTCAVHTRALQSAALVETACSAVSDFDGVAYCHLSTRYVRAKLDIPAGSVWVHCPAVELHYEEEGGL
jgi:hypothetical protein